MTNTTVPKKPAHQDWHPADVIAELRKAEWSLQQLSFANGYTSRTALATALHKPYPKAERIIAETLGLKPGDIWPSRYERDRETPNRNKGGAKPRRPANYRQRTTATGAGNTQAAREILR